MSSWLTRTPPKPSVGSVSHLSRAPINPVTTQVMLRKELAGLIAYDDANLLGTIYKIDAAPTAVVARALEVLAEKDAKAHFNALKKISEKASANGKTDTKKKLEKSMYPHLVALMEMISVCDSDGPYQRVTTAVGDHPLKDDKVHAPLDRRCDLGVFDSDPHNFEWRLLSSHVEVKALRSDGPSRTYASRDGEGKEICQQVADAARAHMASRPFQIYSLALVICGTSFWCTMYDRGGVTISPEFSYFEHRETFVRVVLQLTRRLTVTELGMDPSIKVIGPATVADRPVYSFPFGKTTWTTEKLLFQSLSLIGRGTSVWLVTDGVDHRVMKMAWRTKARTAEFNIYQEIRRAIESKRGKKWPKGVAIVKDGADVAPTKTGQATRRDAVSVMSVRKGVGQTLKDKDDIILHRLILEEVGRSITEWRSPRELLTGIYHAIEGHRSIYELGFLHRDISAGNVLLAAEEGSPRGHVGFITDLEFAKRIDGPMGPAMSGTAQFMAMEILNYNDAILGGAKPAPLFHGVHHDLESFVYVLIYAILNGHARELRASGDAPAFKKLNEYIGETFGRSSLRAISRVRGGWCFNPPSFLPPAFVKCVQDLVYLIGVQYVNRLNPAVQQGREEHKRLTYDGVLKIFEAAIDGLPVE